MNRYLFLLSWVEGSDSAGGESTGIHEPHDLLPQHLNGNKHVFAVEIQADSEEIATVYGRAAAWHDNYTAYDSVTDVVLLVANHEHKNPITVITAHSA